MHLLYVGIDSCISVVKDIFQLIDFLILSSIAWVDGMRMQLILDERS